MAYADGTVTSDESILREARERFKLAVDAEADIRKEALDDLRFVNGEQWDEDVKAKRRGRPCHTNNRLPQFVNQVVNEQRKSRPSILVSPVGPGANVKTATVIQGIIRHIERISRGEVAYDTAFQYAVSCSFGHFRITTDYLEDGSFDQELRLVRIDNPFSVYTDPDCNEPDGIDAEWRFVTEMVRRDKFKAEHGFDPTPMNELNGVGDDNENWFDDEKVRVAEYWRVVCEDYEMHQLSDGTTYEGTLSESEKAEMLALTGVSVIKTRRAKKKTVEQYLMTGDRIIKKSEWLGKYIPIVSVVGGELNIEGKKHRYSLFRFAKDAVRMDNYWSSTEAEMLALQPKAPFIGAKGFTKGLEAQWNAANTSNAPYLEYEPVLGQAPPQRQIFTGSPVGIREARMAAIEDQKAIMGLHDASLGARSNEVSGVAIRARQQEGDIATYHFIDAMGKAIESAGRILIDLIPKVYDTARVVRIVKPDDQAELVAINQMFIDPQTGEMVKYDLMQGHYDVAVKVGPSYQTQREEAREAMLEFIRMYPQAGPITGDLIATNMDWPEADKFAERLRYMIPPQALGKPAPPDPLMQMEQMKLQGQIQAQQMKMQSDMQFKQMDMQAKQMELQLKYAELQMKRAELEQTGQQHQLDAAIAQMDAQMKANTEAMKAQMQQFEISERARQSDREDAIAQMRIQKDMHSMMMPLPMRVQ